MNNRVSLIIPTYQAEQYLPELLYRLHLQTHKPDEVLIIDSSSLDETNSIARESGCRVRVIPKANFSHGGTRNLGAQLVAGEILLFMTQDALPVDEHFVETLTAPLLANKACASYARQLPKLDAPPPEAFGRQFNYPEVSHFRTATDVRGMGIKAFFFSNVASAVVKNAFWKVGGFPINVIMNEDMFLCAKLLRDGGTVAYQAEAKVYHSHAYSLSQQFRRYFDIGVAMTQCASLLQGAGVGAEGVRFAMQQLYYLMKIGAWEWIPRSLTETLLKYIAIQLGSRERIIPKFAKKVLSMHAFYWG